MMTASTIYNQFKDWENLNKSLLKQENNLKTLQPLSLGDVGFLGTLDDTFNIGTGFNSSVIIIQSNDKILVGGQFTSYDGNSYNRIIRLNSDGSVDTSFVIGTGFDNGVFTLTTQSDGKILAGGNFTSYDGNTYNKLIRLNSDGSVDTSFVIGTGFSGNVSTITIQSNGKILVGGYFTAYDGNSYNNIIRLNSDGSIDTSFVIGTGFDNGVVTLTIQSDGKILAGGQFGFYDGNSYNRIIRLNSNGSIDTSFVIGSGFNGYIATLVVQSDGKILVGGTAFVYDGNPFGLFIRLNSDGSVDTSFVIGTGFGGFTNTSVVQSDGKILVGGGFSTVDGYSYGGIVRLNSDGSVDTSLVFGTGFNGGVYTLVVQSDGKIITGGDFTSYDGNTTNYISRLEETPVKIVLIESCLDGTTGPAYVSPLYNVGDILFLDYYDSDLDGFIKSCFNIVVELPFSGISLPFPIIPYQPIENCESCVSCNGVYYIWEDCLNPEISGVILSNQYMSVGDVFALPIYGDGEDIIGISPCKTVVFIPTEGPYSAVSGSPVVHSTIVFNNCEDCITQMVDVLPGYVDTSFVYGTGFDNTINSIVVQSDGKILVGGAFTDYNGTGANKIIRLNTDGSIDTSFVYGTGFDDNVFSIAIQSDGKILIVGGFYNYDGTGASSIIRLNTDGSVDTSFVYGVGFQNVVLSIDIQSDGKIVVGGGFNDYDGTPAKNIIRLNTDGSVDTSFVYGTGFNSAGYKLKSITIQSDGKIVAGGQFTDYNGTSANNIIRLNTDGSVDTSFVYGTGFDNVVLSIDIQSDGKILIGGLFGDYNGTLANGIIRLNTDGSVDTSFVYGTGFNSEPFSIAIQSDGKILVGGVFTDYNGTSVNNIIQLNTDGSVDTSFVYGTGFNSTLFSIAIQSDGKILVGGDFTDYNGTSANRVIRLESEEILSLYNLYEFTTCDGDSSYVYLPISSYTTDVIKGNLNNTPTECGNAGNEISIITAYTFSLYYSDGTTTYENCDSCVSTIRYKVTIKECATNEVKYVTMTQSSIDQILNSGPIFSDGGIECYEILDYCIIPNDVEMLPYLFYDNCELCLSPLSANTETNVCIVDCSGNTISVTPPHPVYTNLRGKAVIQLNMISLGGENGLNS